MSRRRWKRKLTASWRGRNDKGTEEYNKRFVISVLVGGAYLVSWLAHVWGGQPWPIGSNMVNYAVVLVLFGVSLLLFGNLFARILPQERGFVRACDARLQGRGAAAALVVSALVTAAYLIYYANIGVSKEFAGPSYSPSSLMAPQMVPLYYLLTVLFLWRQSICC